MTEFNVKCPGCGEQAMRTYPDGKTKLRTSILIWDDKGNCACKCSKCKAMVPISIALPKTSITQIQHVVFA